MGASTNPAIVEWTPSAPTTNLAEIVNGRPSLSSPVTPDGRPERVRVRSVTRSPTRTSAPASAAACPRIGSMTVRRGAYSASTPCAGSTAIGNDESAYGWLLPRDDHLEGAQVPRGYWFG